MEQRNVERCIVSPLNHKGSRPKNEEERATMLENFRPYKGRIDRMTILDAGEVETVDAAMTFLKREMADGAIAFGEHYGVGLMFDDPKNLLLYEACEKAGLPVMFHIDQNKNMVEPGMARVDRVLKMFPNCKLIAHAYWWRQLKDADRQLQEHPNLYADMSGHVVVDVLNRDRKFAREFLIRNQDKILWATDEGWWSFADEKRQMNRHYTFLEELDLPAEVRRKIYRGNAERVENHQTTHSRIPHDASHRARRRHSSDERVARKGGERRRPRASRCRAALPRRQGRGKGRRGGHEVGASRGR